MDADSANGDFVWDDDADASGNVVHIWGHGVTPTEAEEAVLDPRATPAEERWASGERRYAIIGATAAGRILLVVFVMKAGAIRVVTAFPAKEREKRRYRRRRWRQRGHSMVRQRDLSPWNRRPRARSVITVSSWDDVPKDMTEAEEDEFWRTHELGDELFDNARPLPQEVQSVVERARQRRPQRLNRPAS